MDPTKKPKGRMSNYTFFVQMCREEHRKQHPNENVNFAEFSKKCSERWKQMSDQEKKRFADMADNDKQRYDREMATYTPPAGESNGQRKRKKKDPNAPKRPLSAFFLFCHDERPAVKSLYPAYSVGEAAKELGERWNKVDPVQKSKYEAQVQLDKVRYEQEVAKYKAGL
jgi:high mobility group protein B1